MPSQTFTIGELAKEFDLTTRAIRFHEDEVRAMGRTAYGVKAVTLDDDEDEVVSMVGVMRSATLLRAAFPADWDESVPARSYGGSPRAWLPYARAGVPGDSTVYLLVPREVALRPGAVTVAFDSTIRLDILDARGHAAQLARRPRTDTHAPAYEVPRASLFGVGGPGTIDLFDRLRRVAVRSGPGRSVAGSP